MQQINNLIKLLVVSTCLSLTWMNSVQSLPTCPNVNQTCREPSRAINLTLHDLGETWYPYLIFPQNFTGLLSQSNCGVESSSCYSIKIHRDTYSLGTLQECCLERCKTAPIFFNSTIAELITEPGSDDEEYGTIVGYKEYEYFIYYRCYDDQDYDDDSEDDDEDDDESIEQILIVYTYDVHPSKGTLNEIDGILKLNGFYSHNYTTVKNQQCEVEEDNVLPDTFFVPVTEFQDSNRLTTVTDTTTQTELKTQTEPEGEFGFWRKAVSSSSTPASEEAVNVEADASVQDPDVGLEDGKDTPKDTQINSDVNTPDSSDTRVGGNQCPECKCPPAPTCATK